jgi:hypothetical protein
VGLVVGEILPIGVGQFGIALDEDEVLGVVGHPAKTLVVELCPESNHVLVGRRRVSNEEQYRCNQRSDLGAEDENA